MDCYTILFPGMIQPESYWQSPEFGAVVTIRSGEMDGLGPSS